MKSSEYGVSKVFFFSLSRFGSEEGRVSCSCVE